MMHYLYQIGIAWLLLLLAHTIGNLLLLSREGWIDGGLYENEPYWNRDNQRSLDFFRSAFTFFIDINDKDPDWIKKSKRALHMLDRLIILVFLLAVAAGLVLAFMEIYRRS